jgi:Sulfotransferase family
MHPNHRVINRMTDDSLPLSLQHSKMRQTTQRDRRSIKGDREASWMQVVSQASGGFSGSQDALLDQAREATGLDDFGPDDFREGYGRLRDELDSAGLSTDGAAAACQQILGHLAGRLRSIAGFGAHPAAMARPIRRPLIIMGIVRSGTTALHKLLSMDPQFQGTEHWLTFAPQPRPARADWAANPDFERADAGLKAMIEIAPEMLDDHGMAVDAVEESLHLLPQSFCSNMFPSQFVIPKYDAWYRATDDSFSYRHFADNLRLIGANDPDRTWLLKNPTDTFSLRQVLSVFPDAMVVQTHRDPVQAIPSIVNLLAGAHRIYRGANVDLNAIFAREQGFWSEAMRRADAVKATSPGKVLDIFFNDFVRDQMATVACIYDHFGLVLSSGTEMSMRDWLVSNPRKSTKLQRFTAEDYGHPTEGLSEAFVDYRQTYDFN